MEVFQDATAATLVANRSLYLNLNSFDYACLRDPSPLRWQRWARNGLAW